VLALAGLLSATLVGIGRRDSAGRALQDAKATHKAGEAKPSADAPK
jgi:hypothetical protein